MNLNTEPIPFASPTMGEGEKAAILRVLESGWLTTASESAAFEKEMAEYLGVPHAMAVSSATAGLHLALLSLGVGPGDWVLVPTYTFVATASTVLMCGAQVRFVDCTAQYLIDIQKAEELIQKSSTPPAAVVCVHFAGRPCDLEGLLRLKKKYGFPIVEDAAHSFPGGSNLGFQGTVGDLGVFSFYANKTITTGEGGMVVTQNSKLAQKIKEKRNHGIDRDAFLRFRSASETWDYQVSSLGYKYNMSDLLSSIGRVQLRRAKELWDKRRKIMDRYELELSGREEFQVLTHGKESSVHLAILTLTAGKDKTRNQLKQYLEGMGIGTSVHYRPVHTMELFARQMRRSPQKYTVAEDLFNRSLSIPLYPDLTDSQQTRIINTIIQFFQKT